VTKANRQSKIENRQSGGWLGTERARTNTSGAVIEQCYDSPYGMNLNCTNTDQSAIHFAGLMYDPETKQFHTLGKGVRWEKVSGTCEEINRKA